MQERARKTPWRGGRLAERVIAMAGYDVTLLSPCMQLRLQSSGRPSTEDVLEFCCSEVPAVGFYEGFWHLLTMWTAKDIHRKPRDYLIAVRWLSSAQCGSNMLFNHLKSILQLASWQKIDTFPPQEVWSGYDTSVITSCGTSNCSLLWFRHVVHSLW